MTPTREQGRALDDLRRALLIAAVSLIACCMYGYESCSLIVNAYLAEQVRRLL